MRHSRRAALADQAVHNKAGLWRFPRTVAHKVRPAMSDHRFNHLAHLQSAFVDSHIQFVKALSAFSL